MRSCETVGSHYTSIAMKNLTLLILFYSINVFSQTDINNNCGAKILAVNSVIDAAKIAKSDINKGVFCLFVQGGIAPIVYKEDLEFEKKYNVNISDFGCTGVNEKISSAYNQEVFKFLDKKYGKKWRKELRKDIIGFQHYKRNPK